jgi:hypothetical protein
LGAALYRLGGAGLIAGAFGKVGLLVTSFATQAAKQAPVTEVAQLFPGIWTGWVPESTAGFFACFAVASAGMALALAARDAQRRLRLL